MPRSIQHAKQVTFHEKHNGKKSDSKQKNVWSTNNIVYKKKKRRTWKLFISVDCSYNSSEERLGEEKYCRAMSFAIWSKLFTSLLPTSRQSCNNSPSTTSACTISQNSLNAPYHSLHNNAHNSFQPLETNIAQDRTTQGKKSRSRWIKKQLICDWNSNNHDLLRESK